MIKNHKNADKGDAYHGIQKLFSGVKNEGGVRSDTGGEVPGDISSSYVLNRNMVQNWKADFLARSGGVFDPQKKEAGKAKRERSGEEKCADDRNDQLTLVRNFFPEMFSPDQETRPQV